MIYLKREWIGGLIFSIGGLLQKDILQPFGII